MANKTLFAQAIGKLPKECIRKIIREEKTDKHSKGYDTWSQFISMMFCLFSDFALRLGILHHKERRGEDAHIT